MSKYLQAATDAVDALHQSAARLNDAWTAGDAGSIAQEVESLRQALDLVERCIKDQLWRNLEPGEEVVRKASGRVSRQAPASSQDWKVDE